jgi:hypothetical protein
MFNSHELSLVHISYFSNLAYKNEIIEIRSKNTRHWWQILRKDCPCLQWLLYAIDILV